MKKFFKILLTLGILGILFVGTWLGVNLWPRKMEAPLWTEEEIALPQEKEKNGYYFLVQMGENPALKGEALDFPDDLLYEDLVKSSDKGLPAYWEEIKKLEPALSNFIQKQQGALAEFQKLLDFPQFVDEDSLTPTVKGARWITLLDLHRIASASVLHKILSGNPDEAYALWLKMFRMDQSLMSSARKLISQMFGIANLQADLDLLSLIRIYPPAQGGDQIVQALQGFDPEKLSLERGLKAEYVYGQNAANMLVYGRTARETLWQRIIFKREVFQKEENSLFRRYMALVQNPNQISDFAIAQLTKEEEDTSKGSSWWFYNPAGRATKILLQLKIAERIQEFYANKSKLIATRSALLAIQPFFPPPPETSPESQGAESGPATRPAETESKPAAESRPIYHPL